MDVDGCVIHLLDTPSPGATSSLSVGRWLDGGVGINIDSVSAGWGVPGTIGG